MSARNQVRVSAILLSLAIVAWVAMGLMLFLVPSFEAMWNDLDLTLTTGQRILVDVSQWLGGRLTDGQVIPGAVWLYMPLVGLTGGALFWRIQATRALRRQVT